MELLEVLLHILPFDDQNEIILWKIMRNNKIFTAFYSSSNSGGKLKIIKKLTINHLKSQKFTGMEKNKGDFHFYQFRNKTAI